MSLILAARRWRFTLSCKVNYKIRDEEEEVLKFFLFKLQSNKGRIMSEITCLSQRPGGLDKNPRPVAGHDPHGESPLLLLRRRQHAVDNVLVVGRRQVRRVAEGRGGRGRSLARVGLVVGRGYVDAIGRLEVNSVALARILPNMLQKTCQKVMITN